MANDNRPEGWLNYQAARKVAQILNRCGFAAYIVGGAVRDMLLERAPKDFDVSTDATPDQILELPELTGATYQDPAQAYGVTRVKVDISENGQKHTREIEVATFRRDIDPHRGRKATEVEFTNFEDDLARRDLTVNALALDPYTNQVIDFTDGITDLFNRHISFIGNAEARLTEDPVRLLRAIRFRAQLKFDYAPETITAITKAVQEGLVEKIATERLRDELTSMFIHHTRMEALIDLDRFEILKRVLPELTDTKGVPQPQNHHGEGDVFRHTLLAMNYLPVLPSKRLTWATLLHDIGKAKTMQPPDEHTDRIHFYNHHAVGSDLAEKVLTRLRFSNQTIKDVSWLVHYHMTIGEMDDMSATRRKHYMTDERFADLFELHKADAHASWGKKPDGKLDISEPDLGNIKRYWLEYQEHKDSPRPSLKSDLGIDGDWLKSEFGLGTGPRLGEILERLEQAYLDHEITTEAEARQLAEELISE